MPLSASSSILPWTGWDRSGLTVEMRHGLLASGRRFFATAMGAQIPVISEKQLAACGCRKFQIDPLGDHISTCNSHSGAKKAHDWAVDQVAQR